MTVNNYELDLDVTEHVKIMFMNSTIGSFFEKKNLKRIFLEEMLNEFYWTLILVEVTEWKNNVVLVKTGQLQWKKQNCH